MRLSLRKNYYIGHDATKGAFFYFSRRLLSCPPSILDPTQSKKFPHIPRIADGKKVFLGRSWPVGYFFFLARLIDSGVFPYFFFQWPSPRLTLLPPSPTFWPSRPLRYEIHYRTFTTKLLSNKLKNKPDKKFRSIRSIVEKYLLNPSAL